MSDYKDKVVVITGAACGIGKELAGQFAVKGAKLALADIDRDNIAAVEKELRSKGAEVFSAVFDVTDYSAMEKFSKDTFARYGRVDLLFNNAGVVTTGTIWEMPLKDWDWTYDVNVMGTVHGIKAFVPEMIKQDRECAVINTAALAGFLAERNAPAYTASKFSIISLSEVFDIQLQDAGLKVRAHVACPAAVKTELTASERNRNAAYYDASEPYYKSGDYKKRNSALNESIAAGKPVQEIVSSIIAGVEKGTFYIVTEPDQIPVMGLRVMSVLKGARPVWAKK